MAREIKSAHVRWEERVAVCRASTPLSVLPNDAVAVIYRPARSAMTSGKARTRHWKLRFEPRTPRYIEPLMRWTGHDDTLAQVELSFPSLETAVAYARYEGLQYVVHGPSDLGSKVHHIEHGKYAASENSQSVASPARLERMEQTQSPETTVNAGLSAYAGPQDVLRDQTLSYCEKRNVLRRWALDAYLTELAPSTSTATPNPSPLAEVIDALIDLDEPELRRIVDCAPRLTVKGSALAA
jgi:ETC complex I subunit conserved region